MAIQYEIDRNKRNNQKIKEKKQELFELHKHVEYPDKKPTKCGFCKEFRMYPIHFQDDKIGP